LDYGGMHHEQHFMFPGDNFMNRWCLLIATMCLLSAAPVVAHHSFAAEFDVNQPITLTGVVTKVEWANPHTFFYVDVKDEATGKIVNWVCEMGSPNGLQRQGWTRNTLKVGMVVSLDGSRARSGIKKVNARNVTVDGKKLGAASSEGVTP
jgi:hypothetical protein